MSTSSADPADDGGWATAELVLGNYADWSWGTLRPWEAVVLRLCRLTSDRNDGRQTWHCRAVEPRSVSGTRRASLWQAGQVRGPMRSRQ